MIENHLGEAANRYSPYRSWNEHRIAGLLDKYGLPFIYEKPTAIVDSGLVRIWYPDFTLSYGMLIEYFGFHGSEEYDRRTRHKLAVYQQNQIPVVDLYQQDMGRGWDDRLLHRIDGVLEQRLTGYRSAVGRPYMAPPRPAQPYR